MRQQFFWQVVDGSRGDDGGDGTVAVRPVTAKGTGVGLKAPDAADRTMTVKYYTGTIREQANKIRRIRKKKERRVSLLFLLNTVGCDQHFARFAAVLRADVAAGFHRLDHAGGAVVADL